MHIGDIFPNPPQQDGAVYLPVSGHIVHPVAILIRSAEGELVHEAVHALSQTGGTIFLNLKDLVPGVYDINIICGHYEETQSLTINNKARKKQNLWSRLFG